MINKWIGIGNLGADPELKYTPNGSAVCDLRMACSRKWKDKDGSQKEETEWVRVTVWGKQGETCKEYLAKGRQVYVEGRLHTEQWTDKQGQKRYTTKIVAEQVKFLGGKGEAPQSTGAVPPSDGDDNVPF
jgi:single-strand DNA-binding protein